MINISKDIIHDELIKRIESIFLLPETAAVKIRDITLEKTKSIEEIEKFAEKAVELSYHDILSDVDIKTVVRIYNNDSVTESQYMKRIDRYGITKDDYLGIMLVEENRMYRIILKNGMRYDWGFEFLYDEKADKIILGQDKDLSDMQDNEKWPLKDIDRFWFMEIQALAKLYRDDFLIADHLANMSINETLVQQMVLRDIKYGTNIHRYGHKEQLEYLKMDMNNCPYKRDNPIFNMIAQKIYCAVTAYDKLSAEFYQQYKSRKETLFDIWNFYDKSL